MLNIMYRQVSLTAFQGLDPPQSPLKRGKKIISDSPPFTRGAGGDLRNDIRMENNNQWKII